MTCRITSSASSIQAPSSGQEPILAALRKAVRGLQGVCSAPISPSTPAATTTCRTEGAPRCLRARLRLRRRIYRPASFSARPADAGAAGGRPGSRFLRSRLSGTPGFLRQTVRPAPRAGRDMLLASRLRVSRPREGAMPGRARGVAVFAGCRRAATRWSRRAGAGRACGMGDGRAFGGALSIWKGAFLAMRAWALPNGRRDPAVLLAEGHGRRRALLLPELISWRRPVNGDWWFVKAVPGSLLAGAASHKVTMHRQHSHHKCFYYFSSSFHRHAPTSVEASRRPLATNG